MAYQIGDRSCIKHSRIHNIKQFNDGKENIDKNSRGSKSMQVGSSSVEADKPSKIQKLYALSVY